MHPHMNELCADVHEHDMQPIKIAMNVNISLQCRPKVSGRVRRAAYELRSEGRRVHEIIYSEAHLALECQCKGRYVAYMGHLKSNGIR